MARSLAEPPCDFSRFSLWRFSRRRFGRIVALRTLVPRWRLPMPPFPEKSRIAMVLFRGLTQLDLPGPFEIFARLPGTATDPVWQQMDPVLPNRGMILTPTETI